MWRARYCWYSHKSALRSCVYVRACMYACTCVCVCLGDCVEKSALDFVDANECVRACPSGRAHGSGSCS